MSCGGIGDLRSANYNVQRLLTTVKADIERQIENGIQECTALAYKTQIVAGMNYFIKVRIGPHRYIHVRLFQPLGMMPTQLVGIDLNQTATSSITYF